jgi:uncharacterized protein (DUF58 family)
MSYTSHQVTKLDYARYLAAALLFFCNRQRDRVGLVTFDHEIVEYVPCSMKNYSTALHALDRATAGRPGSMRAPLLTVTERLRRKGILVLVSDFYQEPEEILAAVVPLRARGHDVIVFHVLDPAELTFPFQDASAFEDLESGEQIPVMPAKLREDYTRLLNAHLAELERRFTGSGIDYKVLDTSKPLDLALFSYLSARERLARVR